MFLRWNLMLRLGDFPDDVLTQLLGSLNVGELRLLPAVCKNWELDPARTHLWYGLAAMRCLEMPRPTSRFSLRSKTDLRQTFFAACRAQRAFQLQLFDRRAMGLVQAMSRRDCIVALQRELAREPALPVDHVLDAASRGGHASLLHAAARYGRVACASYLLHQASHHGSCSNIQLSMLEMKDAGGATPLLVAAWCGHLKVVRLLLSYGAQTSGAGIPPMTSSCGGKGPYDAETWADRKGFHDVADEIRAANGQRDAAQSTMWCQSLR